MLVAKWLAIKQTSKCRAYTSFFAALDSSVYKTDKCHNFEAIKASDQMICTDIVCDITTPNEKSQAEYAFCLQYNAVNVMQKKTMIKGLLHETH